MTEREKIMDLLVKCAEHDGDFGVDNAITFYHAAQEDAFEQAASLSVDWETLEKITTEATPVEILPMQSVS